MNEILLAAEQIRDELDGGFSRRHLEVTRPRLRIIVKETRGYPTGYLQAPSDTVEYDREPHEVK